MPVSSTQPVFPPPSGSPIQSVWGQAVSEHVVQRFVSIADRDANWTNPPNGAKCTVVALAGQEQHFMRRNGVWCLEGGFMPWANYSIGGPMSINPGQWHFPWTRSEFDGNMPDVNVNADIYVPLKGIYILSMLMVFGTAMGGGGLCAAWIEPGDGTRRLNMSGTTNANGAVQITSSSMLRLNANQTLVTNIFLVGTSAMQMGAGLNGCNMSVALLRQIP